MQASEVPPGAGGLAEQTPDVAKAVRSLSHEAVPKGAGSKQLI